MKPLAAIVSLVVFTSGSVLSQDAPAFAKEVQGKWYVLTAHSGNRNLALGDPAMLGSAVTIMADRLTWNNPGDARMRWITAACKPARPAADPKFKQDLHELVSVVNGSLCPKQGDSLAARWRLTDHGVLLVLVQRVAFTGNRNGTYSGAAAADVLLALRREPVPALLSPDHKADAKRFIGTWLVLTELDDANAARTGPGGQVTFTADRVEKRAGKSKPMQGSGSYVTKPPTDKWGRIDLLCPEPDGRCPSLYAFYGEYLLYIVWPESGWKGEAAKNRDLRMPPAHFQSDGDCNLWILQRKIDQP